MFDVSGRVYAKLKEKGVDLRNPRTREEQAIDLYYPVLDEQVPVFEEIAQKRGVKVFKHRDSDIIRIGAVTVLPAPPALVQRALLDYRDRFADLLTGDRLMVDPSEGPNGTLYRVQYGPLALDKAQSLCAELRQREQSCLVRTIPDD